MSGVVGSVDFGQTKQTIDSFGAMPSDWTQPAEYGTSTLYDQLINDLGASGGRASIPQDFERENDNADPNVFDWSKYDSARLGSTLGFLQRLKERGAKTFFVSIWSPPYWQKTNRVLAGGGSIRPDMRGEFAEFCAAVVIAAKRDYGIDLAGISVQNEQFFVEPYESAVMDPVGLRETVLAVQQKLAREGLKTKVIANEDLGFGGTTASRWQWYNQPVLSDPQIDRSRLIIASHVTDIPAMPSQAAQLAGTGLPLWYTEVSGEQPNWVGGMGTANQISDILTKANANAYYYYLFDNSPADSYETPPLVGTASLMSDGVPNAKYHTLKHFFRYIRPGMQRVATSITDATGTSRLSAFKDAKGNSTLVLINDSATERQYTLNLSNLGKAAAYTAHQSTENNYWQSLAPVTGTGSITITLPAKAIVTLHDAPELPVATGSAGTVQPAGHSYDMTRGGSGADARAAGAAQLREAAYNGDLAKVQLVLGWMPAEWLNDTDAHGWNALHAAAASIYARYTNNEATQYAIVDALIAAGVSPTATTDEGFTPLHVAAMNSWIEYGAPNDLKANIAQKFIVAGDAVNARDNAGRTALHWAALTPAAQSETWNNPAVTERLLALGADKALTDDAGRTAYDYAMQEYKPQLFNLLGGAGLDMAAPRARFLKYVPNTNSIPVSITENVTGSLTASDVQIVNVATNAPLAGFTLATPAFASGITTTTLSFAGRLPDGKYRLTIAAGAFADQNGVASTEPVTLVFTVLRGDANGNGVVNFDDLLTLAANFNSQPVAGRPKLWSDGDFDGNGIVDFNDLLLLASNFNKSL